MTGFDHRVEISPGHCWLHQDSSKNYGVGSCTIHFYCIGEKGAVQFVLGTDWFPEAARQHLSKFPPSREPKPRAWDLSYHSREPRYEGQSLAYENCSILNGPCYSDGSALMAEEWLEGFLNGGTEWLWPKLEEYYLSVFENGSYPDVTPVILPNPAEGQLQQSEGDTNATRTDIRRSEGP